MIGKGATPSFFAIANDNYTLTKVRAGLPAGEVIIFIIISSLKRENKVEDVDNDSYYQNYPIIIEKLHQLTQIAQ